MSEVWFYLKKSLHCKPQKSQVNDPKATRNHRNGKSKKGEYTSNTLKSQASNSMFNPVIHEIVIDDSSSGDETKFSSSCYPYSDQSNIIEVDGKGVKGPPHRSMKLKQTIVSIKTHCFDCDEWNIFSKPKVTTVLKDAHREPPPPPAPTRRRERDDGKQKFAQNNISGHSVIQLLKQESSCEIIKKICEANGESKTTHIECVLKVLNTQKTLACFEECRKMVMSNVERLQNKQHPRCLVDGNELLRFHGTTIACSGGINGFSTLCTLEQCGVCQILRHGFSATQEFNDTTGVFTTSTCGKAIDSICSSSSTKTIMRKCVLVCRVIAGRININPVQEIQETNDSEYEYDSLVRKISDTSDIEELNILNPGAILPCFVVIY